MATIANLAAQGVIEPVDVEQRDAKAYRRFYGSTRFIRWAIQDLPTLDADWGGRLNPLQQMDTLLLRFIRGRKLIYWEDIHEMEPLEHDVWELKTTDIRIFGWFPERDVFIAVIPDMKARIEKYGLYPGYRDAVIRFRNELDLTPPKYQPGASLEDVLSIAP